MFADPLPSLSLFLLQVANQLFQDAEARREEAERISKELRRHFNNVADEGRLLK